MNYDAVRKYLLSKPEALETYPFGPDSRVYKIRGKTFAVLRKTRGTEYVNLKCKPQEALALREMFPSVIPGFQMNKRHWNTVILDGSIPAGEIQRMIDHSYALVIHGMPTDTRTSLEQAHGTETLYGDFTAED